MVAAAAALLASDGAEAVTHRAVARRAGVAHGSLSYHFGTVDELIARACLLELQTISGQLWELLNCPSGNETQGTVPERLLAWVRDVLLPDERRARLLLEARLRPAAHPKLNGAIEQLREDARVVIARLSDDAGRVPDREDGRRLLCIVDGHVLDRLSGAPVEETQRRLADLIEQIFGS